MSNIDGFNSSLNESDCNVSHQGICRKDNTIKKKKKKKEEGSQYSSDRKHILVLDGLKKPSKYKDSRVIKKEFFNLKEKSKINFAYQLSRGGLAIHPAIHTDSEKDLNVLKGSWHEEGFDKVEQLSKYTNLKLDVFRKN